MKRAAPAPLPEPLPLTILHEDDAILVVDKPAGLIVHPAPGHETGTLVNAALAHFPGLAGVGSLTRPGIVHRLDQDTSGVMVLAKTQAAYLNLRAAFESHRAVEKIYLAVTHGAPHPPRGTLETYLARKNWDAQRMAVTEGRGVRAVTHWETLQKRNGLALVEFTIATGRMHQIRVHAAHLGAPIAGDPLYGDPRRDRRLAHPPARTLLHAVSLSFPHPSTGRRVTFAAEPPPDILYAR